MERPLLSYIKRGIRALALAHVYIRHFLLSYDGGLKLNSQYGLNSCTQNIVLVFIHVKQEHFFIFH